MHMSSKNYKKNGHNLDLDLLTISYDHMFCNLGESGLVGKSNCLRSIYLKWIRKLHQIFSTLQVIIKKPRLFQMMLNYLYYDLLVPYKGNLKTPIWHGVHPCYYVLVKEECTHHNPIIQFSSILHVLYVNILFIFLF